ncbi:MAG: MmcQ/YjbR family DNA-binding protein [Chlorobia bacterium]|nr:MmcQ/YjbR family DNA-binding protein [Fimbriimonadaceae bacterium]
MEPIDQIRPICMELPSVEERLSHGAPTFFHLKGKSFVMYVGEHHGERLAVWMAAAPGAQEALVQHEPDRFFRPPYVGGRGWVGVFLDREVDWEDLAELVKEAYKTTQSPSKRRA